MNKLIMRLLIILIGLSIISCDPKETFEDHLYQRTFRNNSDKEIKLVYHNFGSSKTDGGAIIDTLTIPAHTKKKEYFENGYSSDGVKEGDLKLILEQNISIYNTVDEIPRFELFVGNEFIREWKGKADYFGIEINTPYNYDSWEINKYIEILKPNYNLFIYGEIIFTITNEDIE